MPTPTSDLEGDGCWRAGWSLPSPQPADPYRGGGIAEPIAFSFAQRVTNSGLIVLGTVMERQQARWTTLDGLRPADPRRYGRIPIITPIRIAVERVAKGGYSLPELYLDAPGGVIGQDCAYYSGLGPGVNQPVGRRALYFLSEGKELAAFTARPGDERYRYFSATRSYVVADDNTITIGPESDMMGRHYDDPPRTLMVDEALREIAALLNSPPATPTR